MLDGANDDYLLSVLSIFGKNRNRLRKKEKRPWMVTRFMTKRPATTDVISFVLRISF